MNYKHFIVVIFILLAIGNAKAQGLQFYGNSYPVEQRTTLFLFTEKQTPSFSGYLDIEFELKILQENTFGYLLHIGNRREADTPFYSLTYSYAKDNTSLFRFNTEGKANHISFALPNDSILGHWLPVKLRIDFSSGQCAMTIGGKSAYDNIEKKTERSWRFTPELVFGCREHLVDVPSFAIRKLRLSDRKKSYGFSLNESQGELVHDDRGKATGIVKNPYWLINDSYHWRKVADFSSPVCMGASFCEARQEILFITPDSLLTYQTATKKTFGKAYDTPLPVTMRLGTSFVHPEDGRVYVYEVNNLPAGSVTMAALDVETMAWEAVGKAATRMQLHHHNGFWNKRERKYSIFGGFGNRRYSNEFLGYDEEKDRWDTLRLEGDTIEPRFYSSMASAPGRGLLYIYGGVGNESGEQGIGHNYYNDLYEVDLNRSRIKRLWNRAVTVKEVSSGQMILSEDGESLYALRYAEYIKNSSLRLYRIALSDGTAEQMGDSIPFTTGSIFSNVSLFYDSKLKELYCVTLEFDEQARRVGAKVYKLTAPPIGRADMERYGEGGTGGKSVRWVFYLLASFAIAASIVGVWRMRRKAAEKSEETARALDGAKLDGEKSVCPDSRDVPAERERRNSVFLYGAFAVYGRTGRDVTHLFSNKLRQVFLYILVNSAGKGEGVSSSSLSEVFWPDKPEEKAKNLKGVTISNLRKALLEVDGIKLTYAKGFFKIEIEPRECRCDYFELTGRLAANPQGDNGLLDIWERGRLLERESNSLFDKYKRESEDALFSVLGQELPNSYRQGDYRRTLRISRVILLRDPVNEKALSFLVHAYKKVNDLESVYKVYSAFIIEYRKSLGENYPLTIEAILKREP